MAYTIEDAVADAWQVVQYLRDPEDRPFDNLWDLFEQAKKVLEGLDALAREEAVKKARREVMR